ncbi:multiheme c-type cytochrome [Thioalbus denitrificans]|uniref:Hydroxylamine oxidoreductase n=1 Tax=Thioalbus denitrificans TaxID=547122 RepID=A0A369CHY5_9GAMM|nr:multiheme c-type cytochrome [Thioalbus denitrificans]RCX32286.1 aerobic hydroxylamine oxidoreductase precursor [Thioalbus denitrificans]
MGSSRVFRILSTLCIALSVALFSVPAVADIPAETFEALGVSEHAAPKELYDKLVERYEDPKQGAGKGKYADKWQPLAIDQYFNPNLFYQPPTSVTKTTDGAGCITCHEDSDETPGAVAAWRKSVHSNLTAIRNLPASDPRFYKKELLEKAEENLRSLGKLGQHEQLTQVGCIDCHVGIGAKEGKHDKDLRMPDAKICGTCHLQQFAERESERDTMNWPHDQWPAGRPSHALGYQANVELATWAAMEEREIASGCTMCHINAPKCDTCHTRHQFSAAEARKPEACATCHNGVDHNEYEQFLLSKHGTVLKAHGDSWNWDVPLKDAIAKGGQTGPTCAYCHMEYEGKFGHNVVRKVRWAFNPTPAIADNLDHEWFQKRKAAWVKTCTTCHSEKFAKAYFDIIDGSIKQGLSKEQEAKAVLDKLYEDGLLVGQKTNRPTPPEPMKDAPGGFFQLFWAKGNNPTAIERDHAQMWEHDLIKLYKGVSHGSPGGYTYTEGWSPLIGDYARIMDENTKLREMAALQERVDKLEAGARQTLLNLDSTGKQASVGGIGGGMLLFGGLALWGWRRRNRELES